MSWRLSRLKTFVFSVFPASADSNTTEEKNLSFSFFLFLQWLRTQKCLPVDHQWCICTAVINSSLTLNKCLEIFSSFPVVRKSHLPCVVSVPKTGSGSLTTVVQSLKILHMFLHEHPLELSLFILTHAVPQFSGHILQRAQRTNSLACKESWDPPVGSFGERRLHFWGAFEARPAGCDELIFWEVLPTPSVKPALAAMQRRSF